MEVPTSTAPVFLPRVDRAIERAEKVAKVRRCRLAIDLLKRRHRDELNAAAIDLANAHDELVAYARGRVP